jgi:hypothetical protein
MTRADIEAALDCFVEFPAGSPRTHVTVTSTLLFAEHIARAERERNAQIADAHASCEGIAQAIAAEIRSQP